MRGSAVGGGGVNGGLSGVEPAAGIIDVGFGGCAAVFKKLVIASGSELGELELSTSLRNLRFGLSDAGVGFGELGVSLGDGGHRLTFLSTRLRDTCGCLLCGDFELERIETHQYIAGFHVLIIFYENFFYLAVDLSADLVEMAGDISVFRFDIMIGVETEMHDPCKRGHGDKTYE